MLPALGVIGRDLGVGDITNTTLIVTAFFLGMAIGQLVVGPLADSYGRKPVVLVGYALFIMAACCRWLLKAGPCWWWGGSFGASPPRRRASLPSPSCAMNIPAG